MEYEPKSSITVTESAPAVKSDPKAPISNPIEHTALYEQFGIEKPDSRTDEILSKIWEFAKEKAENKDRDSIVWEVIKLKNKLGSASSSERPWTKILNYVTVYRQFRQAEERLKELDGKI